MASIVRKQRERSAAGKRSSFAVNGRPIKEAQMESYLKRADISADIHLIAVDAPTPPGVIYSTPSPTDTTFGEQVDRLVNAGKSFSEPGFAGEYSEVGPAGTESTKGALF
jgi:hypothetical protein